MRKNLAILTEKKQLLLGGGARKTSERSLSQDRHICKRWCLYRATNHSLHIALTEYWWYNIHVMSKLMFILSFVFLRTRYEHRRWQSRKAHWRQSTTASNSSVRCSLTSALKTLQMETRSSLRFVLYQMRLTWPFETTLHISLAFVDLCGNTVTLVHTKPTRSPVIGK